MADQGTATPTAASPTPVFITPPPAPPPVTGPQPKAPTLLDPPKVFYNTIWRVAPLVVDTQEAADALDPNEWMENPPPPGAAAEKPQWPQLYYNVNVVPKIVNDGDEAKTLGEEWKQFTLPDALCKAAEAANAAKAKADAAKQAQGQGGQAQTPGQGQPQAPPQGPYPPGYPYQAQYPGQTQY